MTKQAETDAAIDRLNSKNNQLLAEIYCLTEDRNRLQALVECARQALAGFYSWRKEHKRLTGNE